MIPDFDFYCNAFLGQRIEEADFPRLADRAADFVRFAVRKPWKPASDHEQYALFRAVCAVAEVLLDEEQSARIPSGISRETVGDYSVSYSGLSGNAADALERRKLQALKICLSGVPALSGLFSVRSFPCSRRIR